MLVVYGIITPYRRLCGSIFLVIAAVLAPITRFALTLSLSPDAARWSIWVWFLLYVLIVYMPGLRRITHAASLLVLSAAMVLVAAVVVFATPVKHAVARATGFYRDALPWAQARTPLSTSTYRNVFAGFTLLLPPGWYARQGPIEGTTELLLQTPDRASVGARLRPDCDVLAPPVPLTVEAMLGESPGLRRYCGQWRGLETCLLEQGATVAAPASPVRWEWLARDPESALQIRLAFELFDDRARVDALAIIASIELPPAAFRTAGCPHPLEWAEPFVRNPK